MYVVFISTVALQINIRISFIWQVSNKKEILIYSDYSANVGGKPYPDLLVLKSRCCLSHTVFQSVLFIHMSQEVDFLNIKP